jgi:DNA-binding transcriptional regulator/RsmH inhibitor MraZ
MAAREQRVERLWHRTLDVYNRLYIPTPMRVHLTSGAVAALVPTDGVDLYSMRVWEQHVDAVGSEIADSIHRECVVRLLEYSAIERDLDARGRITIPGFLVGLLVGRWQGAEDRAVTVVSAGDHIEIRPLLRLIAPTFTGAS